MPTIQTNSEETMARMVESTREVAYAYIIASVSEAAQATIAEDTQALIIGAAKLLGFELDLPKNLVVQSAPSRTDVEAEAKVQSARLANSIVSTWFEHILMAAEAGYQDIVLDERFCLTDEHEPEFNEDLLLAGSRYGLNASGTIRILTAGCSNFLGDARFVKLPDGLYLRRVGNAYTVLSQERNESFDSYLEGLDRKEKIQQLAPVVFTLLTAPHHGYEPADGFRRPAAAWFNKPAAPAWFGGAAGFAESAAASLDGLTAAGFIGLAAARFGGPTAENKASNLDNDRLLTTCTYIQAHEHLTRTISKPTDNQLQFRVRRTMVKCTLTFDAD